MFYITTATRFISIYWFLVHGTHIIRCVKIKWNRSTSRVLFLSPARSVSSSRTREVQKQKMHRINNILVIISNEFSQLCLHNYASSDCASNAMHFVELFLIEYHILDHQLSSNEICKIISIKLDMDKSNRTSCALMRSYFNFYRILSMYACARNLIRIIYRSDGSLFTGCNFD